MDKLIFEVGIKYQDAQDNCTVSFVPLENTKHWGKWPKESDLGQTVPILGECLSELIKTSEKWAIIKNVIWKTFFLQKIKILWSYFTMSKILQKVILFYDEQNFQTLWVPNWPFILKDPPKNVKNDRIITTYIWDIY